VRYTGLSFVKSEQIRFRHRLVGLDETWIDAGDRRTVAYHRIPPGRYEFQVMAANSDGIWSDESDRATIVVLAPVWQRWWFLSTVGLAALAAVVAAERRRARRQRREHARQQGYARQLLDAQERERRRISNDLHDSLGQSLLLIRAQARTPGNGQDGPERTGLISSLAGKAYEEMKEIAYDLRPYHLDKIGVSRTIEGMLRRTSGAFDIALEADIDNIDDAVPAHAAIHVYRIVQESVTNIVRHSAATRARVSVRREAGGVEIEIADNGRGIRAERGVANGAAAAGLGLMGIEERARSLNGDVTIQSAPGAGTTIRVSLPSVTCGHA
jgi:signal transduction histidine kinase